jgi:hypothetical protein
MSENYYGAINIPKKIIDNNDQLQNMISDEGFDDEYYDETEGTVQYGDAMACNGMFDGLEDYLREKKIPFDRSSGAHYEIDAERVIYRPAAEGFNEVDLTLYCFGDGEDALALKEIKSILDESKTDEEIASKVRALYQANVPISLEEYMIQYGDKILPAGDPSELIQEERIYEKENT